MTKYCFLLNLIFVFIVHFIVHLGVFNLVVTWLFLLSSLRFAKMLSNLSMLPTL